jgi:catechol 2,3-dioxygenase-like lactoylglutathione lyase family enzyme
MKVTRLLHASINVEGQLGPTAEFYESFIGLAGAERPDFGAIGGRWFTVGDAQLHLVDAAHQGAPAIDPTGPHFCFGVDDLDGAVAEFAAKGIAHYRAGEQVWITDPSGFTIEFQQD